MKVEVLFYWIGSLSFVLGTAFLTGLGGIPFSLGIVLMIFSLGVMLTRRSK